MSKVYRTRNMCVSPSVSQPGKWFWDVFTSGNLWLECGFTDTKSQAIRNARNFIKNNQNAVYG